MKYYASGAKEEAHKEHINKYKMAHMIGVAEYMRDNAYKYRLNKDLMYMLGLLHDIGYVKERENHEMYGFEMLTQAGFKADSSFAEAIRDHGTSPYEIVSKVPDVEYNLRDRRPELFLLYEADMNVGIDGFRIGFKKRLKDIKDRYGEDSEAYKTASQTVQYVTSHMYDFTAKYGDVLKEGDWFKDTDTEHIYAVTKIYCDVMYFKKVNFNIDDEWYLGDKTYKITLKEFEEGDFDIYH